MSHELSQPLAEGSHYQNLYTTSRSGASESSAEIQQLRQERDHLNVHDRNLEIETPTCQSAVRTVEVQVVQIIQLRGMLEVERKIRLLYKQKFFALDLEIYRSLKLWTGRKKSLPSCKLAAMNFGIILSPYNMREMDDISLKD